MAAKHCPQFTLCLLLSAAQCLMAHVLQTTLYLEAHGTWSEAREYCTQSYVDMIPLDYGTQIMAESLHSYGLTGVWIGAYRDPENPDDWKSIGLGVHDDSIWLPADPEHELCATLHTATGLIEGIPCTNKLQYVCLADNLEVVKEKKTWEEALQHCQDMEIQCDGEDQCQDSYSLLTLKNSDYDYVRQRVEDVDTDEIWIGLRFLGRSWFWLDGEEVGKEGELPHCPSQRRCGVLSKHDKRKWITRDCSERKNFVCVVLKS